MACFYHYLKVTEKILLQKIILAKTYIAFTMCQGLV